MSTDAEDNSSGKDKLTLQRKAAIERRERMEAIQDKVFLKHLETLDWATAWAELEANDGEMPQDWERQLGKKKAKLKFAVAQAALKPSKYVPYGLKASVDLAAAGMKVRLQKAPQTTNVQINAEAVQVIMPSKEMTDTLPRIALREEEDV